MRHKVFVSYYHHDDQEYANLLRNAYGDDDVFIDRSLEQAYEGMSNYEMMNAIRTEHLKDSTVTIVLIGTNTYKRKWVDWEIYASLRPYGDRTRNGLLGIYIDEGAIVPRRWLQNINSGYATTMNWRKIICEPALLERKIDEAYENRVYASLVRNEAERMKRNLS